MGYLIRMIARSKWEAVSSEEKFMNYPSHPITADLKTDIKNCLSVWRVEDIDDIKLIENVAIALCVSRDQIKRVQMVLLPEEELINKGFTLDNDPESAKSIDEYNYLHRDVANLNYSSVGRFAEEIVDILQDERMYKEFSKPKLKMMIKKRIEDKEINPAFFKSKEKMLNDLGIA